MKKFEQVWTGCRARDSIVIVHIVQNSLYHKRIVNDFLRLKDIQHHRLSTYDNLANEARY